MASMKQPIQQHDTTSTSVSTLPKRKPSMRGLRRLHLSGSTDSSDGTTSNVTRSQDTGGRLVKDTVNSSSEWAKLREDQIADQRSVDGTPLFTITEQSSIPTLKTMPSNQTFQRRILTWQSPELRVDDQESWHDQIPSKRRRQCASLDETQLHRLRRVFTAEPSQEISTGVSSCGLYSDEQSPRRRLPKPAAPPFEPPERIKTPDGVPSWPGDPRRTPQPPMGSIAQDGLFARPRHRTTSGLRLRDLFRRQAAVLPTAQRQVWRPPVSGHATLRYGQLENHPFTTAPIANIQETASPVPPKGIVSGSARTAAAPASTAHSVATPEIVSNIVRPSKSLVSSELVGMQTYSQRALRAASGSAIPVPSLRATKSLSASQSARRVALPPTQRMLFSPSSSRRERSRSTPGVTDTLRTTELIDAFPTPPVVIPCARTQSSPRRPPVFHVFRTPPEVEVPQTSVRSLLFGASSAESANSLSAERLSKKRSLRSFKSLRHLAPCGKAKLAADQQQGERLVAQVSQTPTPTNAVVHSEEARRNGTVPRAHVVSIRGEASSRYRRSDTPVYEGDAASLRSFDERLERYHQDDTMHSDTQTNQVDEADRTVSTQTGSSRYFSAVSEVSTTATQRTPSTAYMTPAVRAQSRDQEQQDRAIANGALRFARRKPVPERASQAGPARRPLTDGNTADDSDGSQIIPSQNNRIDHPLPAPLGGDENTPSIYHPVTITTHEPRQILCPHGHPKSHPPKSTATATPDPSHLPLYQLDGPPPITPTPTAVAQHVHLRHAHARGTWRTRMQRTKCWRCDLHRRKEKGWERLKVALGWTCFCRFKNYDEEGGSSEEEREREREMADELAGLRMVGLGSTG